MTRRLVRYRHVLLAWGWAVVTAAAALAVAPRAIGHDEAFYLVCGSRIARGEVPYRDFFDINPPLVMYVSTVPALLARILHVSTIPVFTVMVTLLSACSALLADSTFRRLRPDASALERLVVAVVPLGPCALNIGAIDPGQREHLFVLLYYPFMLERIARFNASPSPSSVAAFGRGVLGAIGVCIKPYFLLPALAVEAGLLAITRRWRTLIAAEVAGAIVFGAAYAAHFLLLPATSREAFFHRVLPLVLQGYGAYNGPLAVILARAVRRLVAMLVIAAAGMLIVRGALRPIIVPAASFTLGGIAAVVVQQKGWSYHYLPADTGLLLLLTIMIAGLVAARPALHTAFSALLVIAFVSWRPVYAHRAIDPAGYPFRTTIEKYTAPGDGVLVLSTSVTFGHPAVLQTDRHFASRHLSALLWQLAVGAEHRGAPIGREQQRQFIDEVAADIAVNRPAAVFIDTGPACDGCPAGRLAHDLMANTAFAQALRPYSFRGTEYRMAVYTRSR
jgi:hypothetical protein